MPNTLNISFLISVLVFLQVFKEDINLSEIKDITSEIIFTYDMENMLKT